MNEISGWGRFPREACPVVRPRSESEIAGALRSGPVIARGAGRAYGDSAMSRGATIDMTRFDRLLDFDTATGVLTLEAGVVLHDVILAFLPRGWFVPVTPGTKFVTIGGMIAADVHGKNHHKDGAFGSWVEWLDLMTASGEVLRCSRQAHAELFAYTLGGMGLTGVILRAAIRLLPVETAWIRQEIRIADDLDSAMAAFEASGHWTYSVAWIDCLSRGRRLGRSVLFLGEHAKREDLDDLDRKKADAPLWTPRRRLRRIPIDAPGFALSRWTVRAFNEVYFRHCERNAGSSLIDWDRYFYPLDALDGWNRIYGRRGFIQFQCVIPLERAREGVARMLRETSSAGQGSFLAVLKRMGRQESAFSFPMEGYTLALDLPLSRRSLALASRLDAITEDHGGRIYLAKDARMSAETFGRTEARAAAFRSMRTRCGAAGAFSSMQSQRLGL